jgi:DNA-binding phage protein
MNKHKTIKASSIKPLKIHSIKRGQFDDYVSSLDLSNGKKISKVLTQMFMDGDHDAFMELLQLYIDHVGKREISRLTNIPERTIYNFKNKKNKTSAENIFKLMKVISQKLP